MQIAKRATVLSGLLFLASSLWAQQDSTGEKEPPAAPKIYLQAQSGVQLPFFSNLNEILEWRGYSRIPAAMFSRGAGAYVIFPKSRLVAMADYHIYGGTRSETERETAYHGSVAGLSLGYNLVNHVYAQLIPFIGLQHSWFDSRLSRMDPDEQPLPVYLEGTGNQYHIKTKGWMTNIGVQASFQPFRGKKVISQTQLGLKVGYYAPFEDPSWKTNGISLNSGPRVNTQGISTSIILAIPLN